MTFDITASVCAVVALKLLIWQYRPAYGELIKAAGRLLCNNVLLPVSYIFRLKRAIRLWGKR
jgi:hypothetical protein